MLRSVCWQFVNDVSGQSVGPMLKGQAVLGRQPVPKSRKPNSILGGVTCQKNESLKYNEPEA